MSSSGEMKISLRLIIYDGLSVRMRTLREPREGGVGLHSHGGDA